MGSVLDTTYQRKSIPRRIGARLDRFYVTRIGPLVRRFVAPPEPRNADGRVLVHLGCGEARDPRYVNVDARPLQHVHHVTHELDLKTFAASSVDLIYACHVLEHMPFAGTADLLKQWHGRLKPGGILRLSVPDFALIVGIYQDTGALEAVLPALMGAQDYPTNIHYNAFDAASLTRQLRGAGFRDVRPWDPKSASDYAFDDWAGRPILHEGRPYQISLNLEATK